MKTLALYTLLFSLPALAAPPLLREEFTLGGVTTTVIRSQKGAAPSAVILRQKNSVEIRLDTNLDGRIDVREFSDAKTRVRYSNPVNGFFRLVTVEKRLTTGVQKEEFYLSQKSYKRAAVSLRPYAELNKEDDDAAACLTDTVNQINLAGDLVDQLSKGDEVDVARLLDRTCKQDPFVTEEPLMEKGLRTLYESRDKGGSQYLGCLNQHGLGAYSAKLDADLSAHLQNVRPAIYCEASHDDRLGSFDERTGRIYFREVLRPKAKSDEQASLRYADVFFHESLHRAGIHSEALTENAVSCCGMEQSQKSCDTLNALLAKEKERNAYLTQFLAHVPGFDEFWASVRGVQDSQAALAAVDDLIEQLKSYPTAIDKVRKACLASGKTADECGAAAAESLTVGVGKYFKDRCPTFFATKGAETCDQLGASSAAMLANSLKPCDGGEKSCLQVTLDTVKATLADANTDLSRLPEIAPTENAEESKKIVNSYLAAFTEKMEGMDTFWFHIKESAEPDRAEAMAVSFLKGLPSVDKQLKATYEKCILRKTPAVCTAISRHSVLATVDNFFTNSCPLYFSVELRAGTCRGLANTMKDVLDANMKGGCSESKHAGTTKDDTSCISDALETAHGYYENYATIDPKKWELKGVNNSNMYQPDPKDKKDAANETAAKPVALGDTQKGKSVDFNPDDMGNMDALKNAAISSPSVSHDVLASAGRAGEAISDAIVPAARAADTMRLPVLQDYPSRSSNANTGSASRFSPDDEYQSKNFARYHEDMTVQNFVPTAGTLEVHARHLAESGGEPASTGSGTGSNADTASAGEKNKGAGGVPASASGGARAPAGKAGGGARGGKGGGRSGGSSARGAGDSAQSADKKKDQERSEQRQMREYIEAHPEETLASLGKEEFVSRLTRLYIQLIDDKNKKYGSMSPEIRLSYDKAQKKFLLPQ